MQETDQAATETPSEVMPPRIVCPVIRAMVHEESLALDTNDRANVKQLKTLLHQLSMPFYSSWPAYFSNRLQDLATNLRRGQFTPSKMHEGMIKHSCTTTILTEDEPGVFNEARFSEMLATSKDGIRMTSDDFLCYHHKLREEPGSTWVGAWLNRLEFSILLRFLGDVDATGMRYLTVDGLRDLYQHAILPRHKKSVVSGRVIRQESGKTRPLAGIKVELWQKKFLWSKTLLAATMTTGPDGAFSLPADLPSEGLPLKLRFIDPRPGMERDRKIYDMNCPGRVNGDLNLGLLRVPHWQYDQAFPFPVARKNSYTRRVPQRFTCQMTRLFFFTFIIQKIKVGLVSVLSSNLSLKAVHSWFPSTEQQKKLQSEDSDDYFMYRILNGFYPSPVYLNTELNSKFPEAAYFTDCNFDDYESDGSHNLISGQLFFDIEDSQPIPRGIHLRIRAASDTAPLSEPETDSIVPCSDTPEWTIAKRAYRSAWATAGELDAHLGSGHLNVGQYALAAYRNFFASPLAHLLLPVLRGVTEINDLGKGSIFGESGVLSTNSPLTAGALWARLGNHLGTLDWYNWNPPQPMYSGHTYALAANKFWGVVEELVEEFFDQNEAGIEEHEEERKRFSQDLVDNCVTFYQAHQFRPAGQTEDQSKGLTVEKRERRLGLTSRQLNYQRYKGFGNFKSLDQLDDDENRSPAIHEIQTYEDMKQCCKYIIFHATFWHWWSNDLQATDLSNIYYTSLGLRNGALGTEEEALPPVLEGAGQLSFAKLLTKVQVGMIMDEKQGPTMNRFTELLEEKRLEFKELQNRFELDSTFEVDNIRSRTNI